MWEIIFTRTWNVTKLVATFSTFEVKGKSSHLYYPYELLMLTSSCRQGTFIAFDLPSPKERDQ